MHTGKIVYINNLYTDDMQFDDSVKQAKYYSYEDGYVLRYSKASFLNESCFVSVCSEQDEKLFLSEDGTLITDGLQITLYIWPLERKSGIHFYQCDSEDTINEQVYVDKNIKCISEDLEYKKYIDNLIEKNEDKIYALLWEAYRKWNLSIEK